jgi:hypothetical protein
LAPVDFFFAKQKVLEGKVTARSSTKYEDKPMNKPLIKIIKKGEREPKAVPAAFLANSNRWSGAVRSWVAEFQKNARSDSPPAFDRLFERSNQQLS